MKRRRPCLSAGCPEYTTKGSYCSTHRAERQAREDATRAVSEPWRMLYGRPEWRRVRRLVLRRDRYQCTAIERGERCTYQDIVTQGRSLQVDHEVPLRELWERAPDLGTFIAAATNPTFLHTACTAHHARIEHARRAAGR